MTTEAPKRIFAWVYRDGNQMTHGWHGKIGKGGPDKTEYVRADIADEMLGALKTMVALARPYMRDDAQMIGLAEARAAIAKAEGTTE